MFKEIKWAYQRVVRGYDDTVFWGFDEYFEQILPALYEFCEDQIEDTELMKNNPKRKEIFQKTIELIDDYFEDVYEYERKTKLFSYIGQNIGFYWD